MASIAALPQPIVIPDLMTLRSLTDVRVLVSHLPKVYRWRHVAKTLDEAAGCGIQPDEVAVALKLVQSAEGITSRPKVTLKLADFDPTQLYVADTGASRRAQMQ